MTRANRTGQLLGALPLVLACSGPVRDGGASVDADVDGGPGVDGGGATATAISAGVNHTCAVVSGHVKCWGTGLGDSPGEMGDNLPAVDLGTGRTATEVGVGQSHACALLDDGGLKCWGSNSGELGLGDEVDRGENPAEMGDNLPAVDLGTGRTAIAIALGTGYTCALLDNHQVKCWGHNNDGELGHRDRENRGDDPGEMGDNLSAVDLGTGSTAIAIEAARSSTCALLDNHQVMCWGSDGFHAVDPIDPPRGPLPVNLGTGRAATAISVGDEHICALLDNRQVKCWGTNSVGTLGLGDRNWRGDPGDELPTVDLGTGRTATAISAGDSVREGHTCALLDNGQIKCWGFNEDGRLGLGDTEDRGDDPGEMGDNLPTVNLGTGRTATAIEAGGDRTCVLLDNGHVKCWGFNEYGGLGLGDTHNRGDGPNEMGDALPPVDL